MATPYTATTNPAWQPEMRSVTPAMTNSRGYNGRYASAPRMGGVIDPSQQTQTDPYRSMTPNRYMTSYQDNGGDENIRTTPSSTGLIRLSLKKPMGIVFEPMYDPHKPSDQRGVRICDLPRTGAAALSRKLQVGDELLQINDTTVSRLTFDEIMDFIIEADPENVNLLFRRPRKETLQARQGVQQKLNAAANKDAPNTVKWVDEEHKESKKKQDKKEKKKEKKEKITKRSKKSSTSEEEETLQSSTADGDSYEKAKPRTKKKTKSRRNPVETESFLDMLIDSICSDSTNVCRDTFRRNDDEYGTDDDESFGTEADEETYATFEESVDQRAAKKSHKKHHDEERQVQEEKGDKHRRQKPHRKEKVPVEPEIITDEKKQYEDDGTLATVETTERPKEDPIIPTPVAPLGLAPVPSPSPAPQPLRAGQSDTDDDGNPAPIRELEYDDRIDHGADVSVMESLGGPSLLIEKQRAAQAAAQKTGRKVPLDIMDKFGLDFPPSFGMTREQTIESDPLKYYTFVVRRLLEDHEPEKVRLLEKLLAKYKDREDHLIQKLSVRYSKTADQGGAIPEETDETAFSDAVKKVKASAATAQTVNIARERLESVTPPGNEIHRVDDWPEKETKEQDEGDEESESESEYSRESIDGTSPAVIAQVSELLNYVYGKTSVPGQIDRVSTIMRAYEGREAVLLELLETKALIKANKEKENADNLPLFLRNSQIAPQNSNSNNNENPEEIESTDLPPVTPMATQPPGGTVINDDISSMSGVSSPAIDRIYPPSSHPDEVGHPTPANMYNNTPTKVRKDLLQMKEMPKINPSSSKSTISKPPVTPDKRKKKGLFGGLFGGKKKTKDQAETPTRVGSIGIGRKIKGVKSVEGSI